MFADLETSLKTLVDGAIAGAPVVGTFDFVDFAAPMAPTVVVRVAWIGLTKTGQKDDAMLFEQKFAVSLIVNQVRVANTSRAAAEAGLGTIISRLIGWRAERDLQPEIDFPQAPDEEGGLWAYTITVSVPSSRLRAQ